LGKSTLSVITILAALWLAAPGAGAVYGDFNRDGFGDLAIGVPNQMVSGDMFAGAVSVLYGSPTGLTAVGDQFWHQDSLNVPDFVEPGDQFGASLAVGDFNADGFADLAIGAPGESVEAINGAGTVTVLYGTSTGLAADGAQLWHQGIVGVAGDGAQAQDNFGFSLATANFGQDAAADLAVGVPREGVGATNVAGAVNVLYGSAGGLTTSGDQFWHQGVSGMAGDGLEPDDRFGSSLAATDLGKSGRADLAIGVPFEDVGALESAGAVNVLYGSAGGLTTNGDQFWHQDASGVAGDGAKEFDQFGYALAAANFGRGSTADLAIGVPSDDVGPVPAAGAVHVLFGSATGLTATRDQFWHQGKAGVAGGGPESSEQFGWSLAAANFGKSSTSDLAVGVYLESVGTAGQTGAVNVFYGSSAGLTTTGDQYWHQDVPGVAGDGAEVVDHFGGALAAANFGRGSAADLAIGVPDESIDPVANGGAVNVLYGGQRGLRTAGNQFWHRGVPGVTGGLTSDGAHFGSALAPRR
jgi:hypothetical protein